MPPLIEVGVPQRTSFGLILDNAINQGVSPTGVLVQSANGAESGTFSESAPRPAGSGRGEWPTSKESTWPILCRRTGRRIAMWSW